MKKSRTFTKEEDDRLKGKIIKNFGTLNEKQYTFSKRLNQRLAEWDMSNKALADKTEISETSISFYVNGKQMPKSAELKLISKALCVTDDYFLGLSDCFEKEAVSMNKNIGLSEDALIMFYLLQHNIEEFNGFDSNEKISNVNKKKLELFSKLISDRANFLNFLTYLEQYDRLKRDEIYNQEEIQDKLLGIEGRLHRALSDSLNNIIK